MPGWEDELLELEEMREEENFSQPKGSYLLCRCRFVYEDEIEALIRTGADLQAIVEKTGATTGCSGCRGPILAMIRAARG